MCVHVCVCVAEDACPSPISCSGRPPWPATVVCVAAVKKGRLPGEANRFRFKVKWLDWEVQTFISLTDIIACRGQQPNQLPATAVKWIDQLLESTPRSAAAVWWTAQRETRAEEAGEEDPDLDDAFAYF